jgi:hypothetical protein
MPFDEVYFMQFGKESSIEIKFRFQQMVRRNKYQTEGQRQFVKINSENATDLSL